MSLFHFSAKYPDVIKALNALFLQGLEIFCAIINAPSKFIIEVMERLYLEQLEVLSDFSDVDFASQGVEPRAFREVTPMDLGFYPEKLSEPTSPASLTVPSEDSLETLHAYFFREFPFEKTFGENASKEKITVKEFSAILR